MPKILKQEIGPAGAFIGGHVVGKVISDTMQRARRESYDGWEVRWWDYHEGWQTTFGTCHLQADNTASSSAE